MNELCRFLRSFLSCLYGSELCRTGQRIGGLFLSCLYGSELVAGDYMPISLFLSCLYGSERAAVDTGLVGDFLSCLYGSEHKIKEVNEATAVPPIFTRGSSFKLLV